MNKNNRKSKRKQNNANRFAVILFVAMLINLSFYLLPEKIAGFDIKKVDLFSDIRIDKEDNTNNLLISDGDVEDIPFLTDIQKNKDLNLEVVPDNRTKNVVPSDSDTELPENLNFDKNDISGKDIEDFSSEHNSLIRFFTALDNIDCLGRPVRIAFVGDSFIEGDIVVADFRAMMQKQFGGRGIGFIPVSSNVSQFRPTIRHRAEGWKTYSIIKNKKQKYVLSGLLFEPKSNNASISFENVDMYPGLKEVSSLKILYVNNESTEIELSGVDEAEAVLHDLPLSSGDIMQFEIRGEFPKANIKFKNATGLQALGIVLEDNSGVIVDNLSLRGNSGIVMAEIDRERCHEMQRIRPYDLIVLQYGLNVASDSVRAYDWYRKSMIAVIQHIKNCYPGADLLLLGVSDRSHKKESTYTTMPAVLSLLRAQRQTAKDAEIAFWNVFAAMGGPNSMVRYVKENKASKDYTHLNFRGGREIANALYDALIQEKRMYDKDQEIIE
jgi:lysophospholipase L1-like esterase